MNEGTAARWKQFITWLIAILFGGFGGAVLNNFLANRSTIIEYTVNRTALGTAQTAVIPDFKVGGASLQSLYIYVVKLQYSAGPEIERANIGVDLSPANVTLVGKTIPEGPSQLFQITCGPFKRERELNGAVCSVGRLSSNVGAYAVSFATDTDVNIEVRIDAKNVQVRQAGVPGARTQDHDRSILILGVALFATLISWLFTSSMSGLSLSEGTTKVDVDYKGTEANKVDVHYRKDDTDVDEIYIRVRVRNLGRRTARASRVFLTGLHEVNPGGNTTQTKLYDALPLSWAGWAFEPRDIPPGICFYADLMRVSKHTPGWRLAIEKMFGSHADLEQYSGTYRFQVTVTADNASPAVCEVDVTYKQDWHTLRAVAVGKS